MSGTFDGLSKQALMRRAYSADSPRQYLSPFRDKMAEEFSVFKIDISDFFRAKLTDSFAPDTEPFWTWHNEWPFYRSGSDILSPIPVQILHI